MKQVVTFRESNFTIAGGGRDRLNKIEKRHRELDERLQELGRRAFLTPPEQREVLEIKKHKLLAKDEMTALRRQLF